MKPWMSFVKTIIAFVVSIIGVLFMLVMSAAYSVRAATVVQHLTNEEAKSAAFSCFVCAGLYGVMAILALFQVGVHWRYRGGVIGGSDGNGGGAPVTISNSSPKPISLQEIKTVPGEENGIATASSIAIEPRTGNSGNNSNTMGRKSPAYKLE